jgi:8-oxo-dGTP diphosphatase
MRTAAIIKNGILQPFLSTLRASTIKKTGQNIISPFSLRLVAAAALINPQGDVLLTERPAGKPWAGYWEFPGGKLHPGETPEAALVRELHEELGIAVQASDLLPLTFVSHAYADFHLLMPLYICARWQGVVSGCEAQALRWLAVAELHTVPLLPADRPVQEALRRWQAARPTAP